jgi:hypothetical protein
MKLFIDRRDLVERFLPKGCVCAELGAGHGVFADQIVEVSRPKRLHLFDAWVQLGALGSEAMHDERGVGKIQQVHRKYRDLIRDGTVTIHLGRLPDALHPFSQGYFDWAYVDAGHDYQEVYDELCLLRTRVKRGGYLAGHDLVLREEDHGKVKNVYPTVFRAVQEFCQRYGWEIVAMTKIGPYEQPDPAGRNSPSYVLQEKG